MKKSTKTYKQVVKEYSTYLKDITHIPQKEVEILLLYILNKNVIWLHINYNQECKVENELKKLVKKRSQNYPLEYITNQATFYGEMFIVKEGVLIPRPETEILVEKAYDILKDIKNPKILEIGIGSGIISVMLAKLLPTISIVAVDINDKALELSKENAKKHNVEDKIEFRKSDLFEKIEENSFDMVISNPPYIATNFKLPKNVQYEPSNALFGGDRGDELLQQIIIESAKKDIKYLACEMGYDQREYIKSFIDQNISYKKLEFYKDLASLDRGFIISF